MPVMVLTGHADHDLALRAVELGAWDFLALPDGSEVDASLLRFAAGEAEDDQPQPAAPAGTLDAAIAALETRLLREAMEASGGNQSEAARRLGVSRVGLIKKLTRLGLR